MVNAPNKKVRILIVDDSAFMRKVLESKRETSTRLAPNRAARRSAS